jgi:NAD(P)-dependent dehydrogenase (short-subunit alcohol dehydrogenase family)
VGLLEKKVYGPSFSLVGKIAVITGGGRGIGKAIALGMAEAGADIVLLARSMQEIEAVAAVARELGRNAWAITADLSDKGSIENAFQQILASAGKIDILVNNAGMNVRTPALDVDERDWEKLIGLNVKGSFYSCQIAARYMKEHGGGKIINIASIAGSVASRAGVVYSMTKAAVIQMTKTLALEWGKYGIYVNAIGPWYVRTQMTEKVLTDEKLVAEILSRTIIKRIEVPEDLVGTAIFLASEASDYITGQTIFVDGGLTVYGF